MSNFKFSDRVKTKDGKSGIVQEDQEPGSQDVKVLLEGEDFAHIFAAEELEKAEEV